MEEKSEINEINNIEDKITEKEMSVDERKKLIKSNERFFKFYIKAPLYIAVFIACVFFVWGAIDPVIFMSSVHNRFYVGNRHYGIFAFETFFGTMIFWWAIGAIVTLLVYFLLKIKYAPYVLQIEYLKEIKEKQSICSSRPVVDKLLIDKEYY